MRPLSDEKTRPRTTVDAHHAAERIVAVQVADVPIDDSALLDGLAVAAVASAPRVPAMTSAPFSDTVSLPGFGWPLGSTAALSTVMSCAPSRTSSRPHRRHQVTGTLHSELADADRRIIKAHRRTGGKVGQQSTHLQRHGPLGSTLPGSTPTSCAGSVPVSGARLWVQAHLGVRSVPATDHRSLSGR